MRKSITIEGLTEPEIDDLIQTAPDGVRVEKLGLTLLSAGTPDVIHAVIGFAAGVTGPVLSKWLWSVIQKRSDHKPEHAHNIRINRQEVDFVESKITRVLNEEISIRMDRAGED